jgi:hypothetical protein
MPFPGVVKDLPPVDVMAPGLLEPEAQVQRRRARIVVGHAEPDPPEATPDRLALRLADQRGPDAP